MSDKLALEATSAKGRPRYLTLKIPELLVTNVLKGNIASLAPLLPSFAQLAPTTTRRVLIAKFTASNAQQLKLASQRAWLPQGQTVPLATIAL